MMESREITKKLRILRDFGIVNDRNRNDMRSYLSSANTDIELDRMCRTLIFDKLK